MTPMILILAAAVVSGGCVAAAAGAGAATGIYLTTRGAESLVNAGVEEVASRTLDAFDNFDITTTKTTEERGGDVRQFEGKTGDLDVTVKLERKSPSSTSVEVTARKNTAEWDKDFAQKVLGEIVGD
jgi:hypothetical protein